MSVLLTKNQRAGVKAYNTKLLQAINKKDWQDILQLSEEIKERNYAWEYECDDESLICKFIGPTSWKSFCRFGDRKHANERLILRWIRNQAEPLDTQAMYLSSCAGKEFNPEQLARFIIDHPGGCSDFHYIKKTDELKEIFKQETGFNWSHPVHNIIANYYS